MFTEPYDFKIEEDVHLANIPGQAGFDEYTMCFWLKLVENWKSETGTNTHVRLITLKITKADGGNDYVTYYLGGDLPEDIRLDVGRWAKPQTR